MIASSLVKHCGHPAAYVVADAEGLEWFVCVHHGDPAAPAARWLLRTPIADWFRARAMPVPIGGRVCNEALCACGGEN